MAETADKSLDAIIGLLADFYRLLVQGTEEPMRELFASYNEIAPLPAAGAQSRKSALAPRLQGSLDAFVSLKNEMKKCYKQNTLPVKLRMPMTGAHSNAVEKLSNCIDANKLLIAYLDSGDPATLAKASALLKPMSLGKAGA